MMYLYCLYDMLNAEEQTPAEKMIIIDKKIRYICDFYWLDFGFS